MNTENLSRLPHCYRPAYPIVIVPLTPLYNLFSVPLTPLYIKDLKDIKSFNRRVNAGLIPAYYPFGILKKKGVFYNAKREKAGFRF